MVYHIIEPYIHPHIEPNIVKVRLGFGTPITHNGKIPDTPETKNNNNNNRYDTW